MGQERMAFTSQLHVQAVCELADKNMLHAGVDRIACAGSCAQHSNQARVC